MTESIARADGRQPGRREGPLAGVRVLDFGWVAVGPLATRLLADMGADVIKVEHGDRLDLTRRLPVYKGEPPRPFSDEDRNPDPNKSGLFNNYNRNKLGITLNLKTGEGREIAEQLIARSDVVCENYSPGIMERWGLTYESMCALRRDIIYLRMSGFGHDGPYRAYKSYGPIAQAVSGLTHISGSPGREPSGIGFAYMDNLTGYYGTSAIMMALLRRSQTGEGAEISLSAVEVGVHLLGPMLFEAIAGERPTRDGSFPPGNRHPWGAAAPHGVYRCLGEDRWCAVAVFGDEDWARFRTALGEPAWAADERFSTHTNRITHQDALDSFVESWTSSHPPHHVMHLLQAHGVDAAAVQACDDLLENDDQLRARNAFFELDHPVAGSAFFEGVPVRFSATPPDHWRSSPLLGEDNAFVLSSVLGYDEATISDLAARGVI